jgi:hypothetical protein
MADDTPQTGIMTSKLGNFSENDPMNVTPDSSIGETIDWFGATKTVGRAIGEANAKLGTVDEYGRPTSAPEPDVDPETLKQEFPQLPGKPAFDSPLPLSVAQGIYDHQQDEIRIADAISRRPGGFWNGAARYGAQFAADMLDPTNIATMFVPVVGEGRFVADGAGFAARTAGRIAAGAVNAEVGQIPLIALKYGLSKQEQDDYGAVNVLQDLALGAGMGATLHGAIVGPLSDLLAGHFRGTPAQTALESNPALRESAFRTTVAQAATDAPIETRPIFDAEGLRAATEARDTALQEATNIPDVVPGSPSDLRIQAINQELGGGAERIAAIDQELGGVIPAARRAELEHERSMVTEGASPERTQALQGERDHLVALEQARSEAARSGLLEAAGRSEAEITSHLQTQHAEEYAKLEDMVKAEGGTTWQKYLATAKLGDRKIGDLESDFEQARAAYAASKGASAGERPGGSGPDTAAGAEGAGQVVGAAQPAEAGGAAAGGEPGSAGAASPAGVGGPGAAERAGPVGEGLTQARAAANLRAQQAATDAQRAADGLPTAAEKAVTQEAKAAGTAGNKPDATLKQATQDTEDHMQFFKAAEAAGSLTDEDRAALQSLSTIDDEAKNRTNAAMHAAACIARGLA